MVFGLATVLGFSILTGNLLLIALSFVLVAVFFPYTTPKRAEKHGEFVV